MIEIISASDIAFTSVKHQSKKNGLLPCPHCGGEAVLKAKINTISDQIKFGIWCECKICHARTENFAPEMENPEKAMENIELAKAHAIDAWNMRS